MSAAALLQELVDPAQQQAGIKLEFLERAKGEDGSTQIQKLVDVLKEQTAQSSVGALPKVRAVDKLLTADSTQNTGAQRGKSYTLCLAASKKLQDCTLHTAW